VQFIVGNVLLSKDCTIMDLNVKETFIKQVELTSSSYDVYCSLRQVRQRL